MTAQERRGPVPLGQPVLLEGRRGRLRRLREQGQETSDRREHRGGGRGGETSVRPRLQLPSVFSL